MSVETFFTEHGVAIFEDVLCEGELSQMGRAFGHGSQAASGRQDALPADLIDWLETHPAMLDLASRMLGEPAQLVRILTFNKTPDANWFVPWHQDRTVAVARKHDCSGFQNWVEKDHYWQVEPPVWLLERMVTLRIHLDSCTSDQGPLQVLSRSHRLGRLARADVTAQAKLLQTITCVADVGDILVMSPLTVHRSRRATEPTSRRVLHLEFAASALPAPLEWAPLFNPEAVDVTDETLANGSSMDGI